MKKTLEIVNIVKSIRGRNAEQRRLEVLAQMGYTKVHEIVDSGRVGLVRKLRNGFYAVQVGQARYEKIYGRMFKVCKVVEIESYENAPKACTPDASADVKKPDTTSRDS